MPISFSSLVEVQLFSEFFDIFLATFLLFNATFWLFSILHFRCRIPTLVLCFHSDHETTVNQRSRATLIWRWNNVTFWLFVAFIKDERDFFEWFISWYNISTTQYLLSNIIIMNLTKPLVIFNSYEKNFNDFMIPGVRDLNFRKLEFRYFFFYFPWKSFSQKTVFFATAWHHNKGKTENILK